MTEPVLFVIDDDPRELAAFEPVLRRRYGADYRVVAERSPKALGSTSSSGYLVVNGSTYAKLL